MTRELMEDRYWYRSDADETPQCWLCRDEEDLVITVDLDTMCARCARESGSEVRSII